MGDHAERGRAPLDGRRVREPPRLAVLTLLAERAARHGLHDGIARSAAQAAAVTCAIQAQDPAAARLGLRVRSSSLTQAEVLDAIGGSRTVARTWLMRATIHLVDTADLRWLVRLIGPALQRAQATRWERLGLTAARRTRLADDLQRVLAGPPLTRAEVSAALGLDDAATTTHALMFASTIGLVCRRPDRDRLGTFTLLDSWVPSAPPGPSDDDALAELARRYFAAYSPATPADFTAWSGLASSRAIASIRDALTPVDVGGRLGFRLGTVAPSRGVRLLPAFDNYLVGWRHRDEILAAPLRPRLYQGGIIHPAVLCDGRVVGRWRLAGDLVTVEPFEVWPARVRRAVAAEVEDLARFLGRAVRSG